ncbi:blue-light-activated protein [Variibacter gotjawalensis]|uniref:Blue-light-activated protein n=1 Tax=Variibacter gotjawalensis TaxID=1333996 RepID=A0A0S3PUB2_9BRAD|nr:response regulator [Variibacter gotjawalensis]NIK49852.1 DNA-binding response OmpR family regulator [Variibacter gotjawalensis]RZS45851.1 response regulator receiver domain-containing protein [Variibacter gotjawalensis]BAT59527.1 blue-light-activated protein [Variibacter gotjawalensis]
MTHCVLIVEDDHLINMVLQDHLAESGFVTLVAFNADEAIEILESRSDIDALVTDIDMPGSMDGLCLAKRVRERWAPIRILVASGKHRPSADDLPADATFLPKPYRLETVVDALR